MAKLVTTQRAGNVIGWSAIVAFPLVIIGTVLVIAKQRGK